MPRGSLFVQGVRVGRREHAEFRSIVSSVRYAVFGLSLVGLETWSAVLPGTRDSFWCLSECIVLARTGGGLNNEVFSLVKNGFMAFLLW